MPWINCSSSAVIPYMKSQLYVVVVLRTVKVIILMINFRLLIWCGKDGTVQKFLLVCQNPEWYLVFWMIRSTLIQDTKLWSDWNDVKGYLKRIVSAVWVLFFIFNMTVDVLNSKIVYFVFYCLNYFVQKQHILGVRIEHSLSKF